MDIKSKNIRYSNVFKIFSIILLCLSFTTLLGTLTLYYYNYDELSSESYYDTYKFKNSFNNLIHNVVELNVVLKNVEHIKESSDGDIETIDNKIDRLNVIQNKLPLLANFVYIIKNTETGESDTNIDNPNPINYIKEQANSVYINSTYNPPHTYYIGKILQNTPYEVYAAVVEPIQEGSFFYEDYMNYTEAKRYLELAFYPFILSIVISIISLIYLIFAAGRNTKDDNIHFITIDKLYIDIHFIIVLTLAIASFLAVLGLLGGISFNTFQNKFLIPLIALVWIIDALVGLNFILSITRHIKKGRFISRTLLYQIYSGLKSFCLNCFNGNLFKAWTLILLLGYGIINGFMFFILFNAGSFGMLIMLTIIIIFNSFVIYFVGKALKSLQEIITTTEKIANGNLDNELNLINGSIVFKNFSEKILSIQGGMKKAVSKAMKSEHMKTTLITNVSHDLKTPLTSIISYVDLLKNENCDNNKIKEYTSILEDKSRRLKQLIEDLIEASKASSGNLEVQTQKLELNELIHQSLGEYNEKFTSKKLDIMVNSSENHIYVSADNRYMWRIVENLFSNFINYTLPNTRVYINIEKEFDFGTITIKNISAFPLNISAEELTERFVRGDKARSTEGSGLGLSIAESLTTLQGGKFNIEIDGDLFKVMVSMPLWD